MVATCSSVTSVDFQRTTGRYIPEDRTLHNHHRENIKFFSFVKNTLFGFLNLANFRRAGTLHTKPYNSTLRKHGETRFSTLLGEGSFCILSADGENQFESCECSLYI
jgi:hypothetical protein